MAEGTSKILKILFILDNPSGRLGRKRRYSLLRSLAQMGHNLKIVCFPSRKEDYKWVIKSIDCPYVEIIGKKANNFRKRFLIIYKIIKQFNPDIVHIMTQKFYYIGCVN